MCQFRVEFMAWIFFLSWFTNAAVQDERIVHNQIDEVVEYTLWPPIGFSCGLCSSTHLIKCVNSSFWSIIEHMCFSLLILDIWKAIMFCCHDGHILFRLPPCVNNIYTHLMIEQGYWFTYRDVQPLHSIQRHVRLGSNGAYNTQAFFLEMLN